MNRVRIKVPAAASLALLAGACVALYGALEARGMADPREWKSGIEWPEPKAVDPGPPGGPPADAVVLFDGKSLAAWAGGEKWDVKDGVATVKGGDITTKQSFGDVQLHVEWAAPKEVKGKGQEPGNSGVFLMNRYEIQILNSFENVTYFDGQAAAVYKQRPPMVNVSRPPGEWQAFDIVFTAPKFDEAGKVVKPAFVTVLHNGVVVHNHTEVLGGTFYDRPPEYKAHGKGPIRLQNHGQPVRFRNIWVREIAELEGTKK